MKQQLILLPKAKKVLDDLGENIKLARRRRKFSTAQVAKRAGMIQLGIIGGKDFSI